MALLPLLFPTSSFIAIAIAIASLLLLLAIILCRLHFRPPAAPHLPANVHRFRYRDLDIATDSFHATHKLGQGGVGIVFKGVLKNGQAVAIKRLDHLPSHPSQEGRGELQNELLMMSHVNNACPHIVRLLGFSSRGKQRLLVYEYMENMSVQEALFCEHYPSRLTWEQRFQILLDASRALDFLHQRKPCPIIHGDVKPSNLLLDSGFRAHLADFGLGRFKQGLQNNVSGMTQVLDHHGEIRHKQRTLAKDEQEKGTGLQRKLENTSPKSPLANDSPIVDFSTSPESDGSSIIAAVQTSEVRSVLLDDVRLDVDLLLDDNVVGVDANLLSDIAHIMPIQEQLNPCDDKGDQLGNGETTSVKEYVMEWMGHKHKVIVRNKDCDTSSECSTTTAATATTTTTNTSMSTFRVSRERRDRSRSSEWWGSMLQEDQDCAVAYADKGDEDLGDRTCSVVFEDSVETGKKDCGVKARRTSAGLDWWRNNEAHECEVTFQTRERAQECGEKLHTSERGRRQSREWWKDEDLVGNANRGKEEGKSRNKKRESSSSCCSDEVGVSKGVSSTPSMRGTICYVAPENGNGVIISEKSDVYSFGVLMLVLVSGRRPLQVVASPITEFERANLVSWTRNLAHSGNLLDLVDTSLKGAFDPTQATLCITVALLCLQKLPSLRPSMNDVLKMLSGEMRCPSLPSQLSPSPRCRGSHKTPPQCHSSNPMQMTSPCIVSQSI